MRTHVRRICKFRAMNGLPRKGSAFESKDSPTTGRSICVPGLGMTRPAVPVAETRRTANLARKPVGGLGSTKEQASPNSARRRKRKKETVQVGHALCKRPCQMRDQDIRAWVEFRETEKQKGVFPVDAWLSRFLSGHCPRGKSLLARDLGSLSVSDTGLNTPRQATLWSRRPPIRRFHSSRIGQTVLPQFRPVCHVAASRTRLFVPHNSRASRTCRVTSGGEVCAETRAQAKQIGRAHV